MLLLLVSGQLLSLLRVSGQRALLAAGQWTNALMKLFSGQMPPCCWFVDKYAFLLVSKDVSSLLVVSEKVLPQLLVNCQVPLTVDQ